MKEGRVHPLDDAADAVYLYGTAHGREPGWYLRERRGGGVGRFIAGPFVDLDQAATVYDLAKHNHTLRAFPELPALTIHAADDVAMAPPPTRLEAARAFVAAVRASTTGAWMVGAENPGAGTWHWRSGTADVLVRHLGALVYAIREGMHDCRVDDFVKLECGEGFVLGPRVHVASFCHLGIGGGITILEEGASTGSGAKIVSGSAVPSAVGCSAIQPGVVNVRSFAWMKPFSTLYAGAILLPGCVLGARSVLAAGSVLKAGTVTGEDELWAGVPAVLKRRRR
jgi:acetyltransferase-like isoleucine patch superfamily enzyme